MVIRVTRKTYDYHITYNYHIMNHKLHSYRDILGWETPYMDVSTMLHHLVGLSSKLQNSNLHITMNYEL